MHYVQLIMSFRRGVIFFQIQQNLHSHGFTLVDVGAYFAKHFKVTIDRVNAYIRFFRLCSAYPVLLNTPFSFSQFTMFHHAIREMGNDKDKSDLLNQSGHQISIQFRGVLQLEETHPNEEFLVECEDSPEVDESSRMQFPALFEHESSSIPPPDLGEMQIADDSIL